MAELFDRRDEYVAAGVGPGRSRLPLRLLAAVFVIAAVAGLGRTARGHPRTVRVEALPARDPLAVSHRRMVPVGTATSTTSPSSTTSSTSTPPATSPPATTARPAAAPVAAPITGYGCAAALAWLATHAAPGFTFMCPGDAHGHQAMTCVNVTGVCPGQRIIAIADPCPAAYMNEAHNSWVLTGMASGRLDPYGWCG